MVLDDNIIVELNYFNSSYNRFIMYAEYKLYGTIFTFIWRLVLCLLML